MSVPRVSIVTPSYNQAQFLEQTILSVIGQDYPEIEYIVIDGGSTDGSQEIIKKYANRIAYWVSEKDNGQSDAINKGFRKCTGEYVAWINSDDVYVPGAISRVVKFFEDHPDVDMVHGDINFIDGRGRFMSTVQTADFTLPDLLLTNRISQPSVFWKRKLFGEIGYLDEVYHYVMDYEFWIRVALDHNIRHVGSTIAHFRLHGESKTLSSNDLFLVEILIILNRLLKDRDISVDSEKAIFTHMLSILPGFLFNRMDKLHKYLEPADRAPLRKLLELSDYRSQLLQQRIQYSDLPAVRIWLNDYFRGYVSQYPGYERSVTDQMLRYAVEDELYTMCMYLDENGQRWSSIRLFITLLLTNLPGAKFRNIKPLLKKYALG